MVLITFPFSVIKLLKEDIYNTNINQMECIRAIDERELSGLRW